MIKFENFDKWNLPEMSASFEENGFLLGGKLLTDESVDYLTSKIEAHLEIAKAERKSFQKLGTSDDSDIYQLHNVWKSVDEAADVMRHPILAKVLTALSGVEIFRLYHDQLQFKPALTGGVNRWHQDVEFWPFKEPYTQITAWIALDDATELSGCMRMVPGSHKWGAATEYLKSLQNYLPLDDEYMGNPVQVVSCLVPKGHVHFHHHLTWHGSGLNLSTFPRRALAFHFVGGGQIIHEPKFGYFFEDAEPGGEIKGIRLPQVGTNFDSWLTSQKKLTCEV